MRLGKTRENLVGRVFGRLTVLRYVRSDKKLKQPMWLCRCEDGKEVVASGGNLKWGHTSSCGCLKVETTTIRATIHGDCKGYAWTKEFRAWSNMKTRCYNPNWDHYADYGGRGITVCDRWLNSFETFLSDVGRAPTPAHSLDRIGVNGNYEPGNVRWATKSIQNANQRRFFKKAA